MSRDDNVEYRFSRVENREKIICKYKGSHPLSNKRKANGVT